MKTFSILGLGWLGYPLSKKLESKFNIKCSIRNEQKLNEIKDDIKKEEYEAFILNENNLTNLDKLLDTNYLFINFPPSKSEDYLEFLSKIYNHPKIKYIEKIFFVSSTSVYPNINMNFTEDFIIEDDSKKKIVFLAENLVKQKTNYILRLSGLSGYNRMPGKFFSGKLLSDSSAIVNFVHRDDVINVVEFFIENEIHDGIFNVCAPIHPTKKELYSLHCRILNLQLPIFENKNNVLNRKISTEKLLETGFRYEYTNPMDFFKN